VVVNVDPLSAGGPVRRPHARQRGGKPRRREAAEQLPTCWLNTGYAVLPELARRIISALLTAALAMHLLEGWRI
jgi:hypothetical protein